jgi:putative protein kinase ArgK-like GTPase of G3E family
LWRAIEERTATAKASGALASRRSRQAAAWLDQTVKDRLLAEFLGDPQVAQALQRAEADVAAGRALPGAAARAVLALRRRG